MGEEDLEPAGHPPVEEDAGAGPTTLVGGHRARAAGRPAGRSTENDSGIRPRSSGRASPCPDHQSVGCSARRSSRRPAPTRAVTISPRVQLRANFQLWSASSMRQPLDVAGRPALRGLGSAEVVVVGREPAAVLVDVEEPLDRVALEDHQSPVRRQETGEDRRPGVEVLEPDQRAATGVEQVGRAVELVGRLEDVGQDPAGRRTGGGAEPGGEIEHPRAEVDAHDLLRAEVPEREGVPAARALEVDRPPASAVEIADRLELRREQVRSAGPDELDRLVQPALVSLGGLVPGGPVRPVHRARVGPLRRGRRADQLGRRVIRRRAHPASLATGGPTGRPRGRSARPDHGSKTPAAATDPTRSIREPASPPACRAA